MIIGASLALPFSWLRFYLSNECGRHLVHLANDLMEAFLYMNELSMAEQGWIIFDPDEILNASETTVNRNFYYLLTNNVSILITLPQIYNTCSINGIIRGQILQ